MADSSGSRWCRWLQPVASVRLAAFCAVLGVDVLTANTLCPILTMIPKDLMCAFFFFFFNPTPGRFALKLVPYPGARGCGCGCAGSGEQLRASLRFLLVQVPSWHVELQAGSVAPDRCQTGGSKFLPVSACASVAYCPFGHLFN